MVEAFLMGKLMRDGSVGGQASKISEKRVVEGVDGRELG